MLQSPTSFAKSLGADLRALRKARGMTLAEMADQLGRSVGWLSQVERDKSEPSISDLQSIAKCVDVPMSMLFGQNNVPAEELGYVVREGSRRPIGSKDEGLVEELLSPDLTDDFEMVHSTFQPYSRLKERISRPTQEVGYLISGQLHLTIGEREFHIRAGDSFRIRGESYLWKNPYNVPAVAIWVIAPPVY